MDRRFCAICNRAGAGAGGGGLRAAMRGEAATLDDLLRFLNGAKVRATYGAVAAVLGVPAPSLGALLGARRPEASWVVNADTMLPTGYDQSDWHPDLLADATVIRTGNELTLRLALWRSRGR